MDLHEAQTRSLFRFRRRLERPCVSGLDCIIGVQGVCSGRSARLWWRQTIDAEGLRSSPREHTRHVATQTPFVDRFRNAIVGMVTNTLLTSNREMRRLQQQLAGRQPDYPHRHGRLNAERITSLSNVKGKSCVDVEEKEIYADDFLSRTPLGLHIPCQHCVCSYSPLSTTTLSPLMPHIESSS